MFEKRLKELSKKIGNETMKEFYVLTHKKHHREVYFQGTSNAIDFIGFKLNDSSLKKYRKIKWIAYLLIKIRLLQPFLRRVKLSSAFGEVIFVAGQIKGFDLDRRRIVSFPLRERDEKDFLKSKKFQRKIAKRGFAPRVYEIDEKIPSSREELIQDSTYESDYNNFKRLMEFYEFIGIKKIPIKRYISDLKKGLKDQGIGNNFLFDRLDELSKKSVSLLVTNLHGDFARENILVKRRIGRKKEILFIDLHPYKGIITNSLINYLRREENLLSSNIFHPILNAFPKEVKDNIETYLVLSEIDFIVKKNGKPSYAIRRIKKHLAH